MITPVKLGHEERVLILAPTGRDASLIASMLSRVGVDALAVPDIKVLCDSVKCGVGALVITEEALDPSAVLLLRETLADQAPWSDLPLILLSTSDELRATETWNLVRKLGAAGNVSLLERPLRALTLSSAVEVALRSRRRQYESRSLYEDLERRVSERSAELNAKNLELEGFTYSVSHDMRAPLRAIVSRASIVLEEEAGSLSEEGVEHLRRLARAANTMAELVDDLLKYARIGTAQVNREQVDVSQLVQELAAELELEHSNCDFHYDIQASAMADCDPRLIGMALRNLLDNACKYRRAGETAQVTFGCKMQDGERVFFVKDQGIGFDMRYIDKLFRPFERFHREEYSGTGIGLANVRRVVERHGGRVWAEGKPNVGATFYFTLP